jgi:predicted AAA+ superfamily ATPase
MATHLTGRQISVELFPFSFSEFLKISQQEASEASLKQYLQDGGMPEYLKSGQSVVLASLVDDIIIKDISVRHSLKDVESLRQLTLFLCANIGNPLSANKLINLFGIKSASTILEYFSHLKDAYLFDFVPRFSYSLKAQARNPKKLYSIDTGICNNLAFKFSENIGHFLENAVYLHLRRHNKSIFYFNESGECDFVVMKNAGIEHLIQVCWHLDDMNLAREKNGLQQAMKFFKHTRGTIVTSNQKDSIPTEDGVIEIVPAYEFFMSA